MNWEAIGAVGEVFGAVAVFLTLLYLARQIRANTRSSETASRQNVANEFRDWVRTFLSSDPEHFSLGLSNYPDMPFRKRSDFCHQVHDLVLFYQSAHAMHEAGVLPDDIYEPYRTWVASVLSTPGGRNFWSQWKATYSTAMKNALEKRIAEAGLPNVLEFPQYQLDN